MMDQQIIIRIKTLAAEERHITAEVIRLLEEVDRRKIFALKGYSSLFEFATKELGYSDSSAQRRISSMRIIKQIPELDWRRTNEYTLRNALNQSPAFPKLRTKI